MEMPLLGRDEELSRFRKIARRTPPGSVVLFGESGVGKSRLANEFLEIGKQIGYPLVRINATSSASAIPLGAFAHLLPQSGLDLSQTDLLVVGFRSLVERAVGGKLMVGVDDAHSLDPASAALIHQVAIAGFASLIVTVRLGETVPDPILRLWKDDLAERLLVKPLSRETVVLLVSRALGGRVEQRALFELWRLSQGNPLLLRELLIGGVESEALTFQGSMWTLSGDLAQEGRVTDLVLARIEGLDLEPRACLDIIAEGDPMPLEILEPLFGAGTLSALEQAQLIEVGGGVTSEEVRIAHPLYREVIDSSLEITKKRSIRGRLADMFEAAGLRKKDMLRVATWRLDSGTQSDPGLLVDAARRANAAFDHELAERLGRAASDQEESFEADLIVAEAMGAQGRGHEADAMLETLTASSVTPDQRARVAIAKASNLLFQLRDPKGLEVLVRVAGQIESPAWKAEVESMVVFATSYVGQIDESIAMAEKVLAGEAINPGAWLRTMVLYSYARMLRGRFTDLNSDFDRIIEAAEHLQAVFPLLEDIARVNHAGVYRYSGDLVEAARAARSNLDDALGKGAPEAIGLWSFSLGATLSLVGDVLGAAAAHEEALESLRARDSVGLAPLSLLDLTYVEGVRGHAAAARHRLQEYLDLTGRGAIYPFGETGFRRAESWVKYLQGDLDGALASSRLAGEVSMRTGELVLGMLALHDSVRWGHPDNSREGLDQIAGEVEGGLVNALAHHARALSAKEAESLDRVSAVFEGMGAWLYAAESGMQAAALFGRSRDSSRARRARARASLLAARCPGARTPALSSAASPLLTKREGEVADLARRGFTSSEIADRLFISVRTVDNHLSSVYRKLGVDGRNDLPKAIDLGRA